jgi:hypothetical protein
MEGIRDEFELFGTLLPERPRYVIGAPGGEARLLEHPSTPLADQLANSRVFPAVARAILAGLA